MRSVWAALLLGAGFVGACGGSEPETPAGQPPRSCPANATKTTFAQDQPALLKLVDDRIKEWHFKHYPDCVRARTVAAQIKRSDSQSSDEVWILESCKGQCFEYIVRIRPVGQHHNVQVLNADDPTAVEQF